MPRRETSCAMRITGYRTLTTVHDWGRPVGDVNGTVAGGITEVPLVLVETDVGLTGVGLGGHADAGRVFPALDGQEDRKSTRMNSSHVARSYAVSCLKKKTINELLTV